VPVCLIVGEDERKLAVSLISRSLSTLQVLWILPSWQRMLPWLACRKRYRGVTIPSNHHHPVLPWRKRPIPSPMRRKTRPNEPPRVRTRKTMRPNVVTSTKRPWYCVKCRVWYLPRQPRPHRRFKKYLGNKITSVRKWMK